MLLTEVFHEALTLWNMNISSVSNRNTADRTAQLVRQRLQGMEDQVFVQLNGNNTFEQVSQSVDGWTPSGLEAAVERAPKLASDPAKGNKITDGSIEEAAVALTAEHQKIFLSATRESSGSAEFIDNFGIAWDVKSPLSPPEGQNWNFSAEHQLTKVRHDLSQGDKVLFNLSRVNDKDRDDTLHLFAQELTLNERGQIVVLTDKEIVNARY